MALGMAGEVRWKGGSEQARIIADFGGFAPVGRWCRLIP
ncbi:Uncharacterized protein ToN1_22910 [Aromatoleum petrolei]|nr:Uncharacterized protein ToN1_22910 [Aromatoleum petrolei]